MTTIKSYTDLEQSKKLAEILPLESADMEYLAIKETGKLVGVVPFVKDYSEVEDSAYNHTYDRIACWSLAALLNAIGLSLSLKISNCIEVAADNEVDACVAMIENLHKLKML